MSEGRHVTRTVSYWVATRGFDFDADDFDRVPVAYARPVDLHLSRQYQAAAHKFLTWEKGCPRIYPEATA